MYVASLSQAAFSSIDLLPVSSPRARAGRGWRIGQQDRPFGERWRFPLPVTIEQLDVGEGTREAARLRQLLIVCL